VRDSKQTIRYVGFASGPEGSRSLEFSFETPSHEHVSISFDIPSIFFTGQNRILFQEAAGICYAKLRDVLVETELPIATRFLITGSDILQYRQVNTRQRHARPDPGQTTTR